VRFRLAVDGRQTFATPGSGDLRDAVAAVYGLDAGEVMLAVTPGDGAVRVSGLAGPPSLSRSSRAYVSLFVNRRWVGNRRLVFAVEDAYRGLLMTGRHPVAVINIGIAHEEVDVNVHPTKAEVRFRDESAVFGAVQRAVRAAVMAGAPVPAGVGGAGLVLSSPAYAPPLWEAAVRREDARWNAGVGAQHVGLPGGGSEDGGLTDNDKWGDSARAAPLPGTGVGVATPAEALPALRVIGQFRSVYIIAEGPDAVMYLIDQHAAHERVLYDEFRRRRAEAAPEVQGLLDPLALELPPRQRALVAAEAESLAAHGFELEPFGEGSFLLRSVPRALAGTDLRERVGRFLDVMLEEEGGDGRDRVAMSLACHGAVRAGKTLAAEEMRELVRQLEATETPHTCPHGRPTMVHVSAEALARGFGRR
jgi:DNA mismatch repair protein MutL